MIVHFQKSAKQFSLAAARTAPAQAPLEGRPQVAFFAGRGFPGPDFRRLVHGFHDLPFFDLLRLPALRSFLRGLRPGCAFAVVSRAAPELPFRRRPRGITLPSDSSSKRNAPA